MTFRPAWLPDWDEQNPAATQEPVEIAGLAEPREVIRAFAFIDLSGFTSYTAEHGPAAAHRVIVSFRQLVRDVAAFRGVRVAKWMGDGAMLVAVHAPALAACVVDIVARLRAQRLDVRGGISVGPALMVDGEDYIGRAVNLASRLCDQADAGEVLADADARHELPEWIAVAAYPVATLKGIGTRSDLALLSPRPDVIVPAWHLPG